MNKLVSAVFAFVVPLILCPTIGQAAVKYWDGGGANTNWATAANWDNDVAPGVTDDVVFDGTAGGNTDKNCFLDASKTCASITFINYDGTFSFGATGRNLTVSTGNADFSGMSVTPTLVGTNAIVFTSTTDQTFTPNPNLTYPGITKNATAGVLTFAGAVTSSGALTLTDGYINIGTYRHSFASVTTGANFDGTVFGENCTLSVSGAVNFRYGTMTAGAGSAIVFTNTSAQNFTPRQTAGSTFPALIQAGGSTTTIVTYALTCGDILIQNGALQCNIGVTGGNLTVNAGTTFGMDNGTARTITVGRLMANGNLNFGISTLQVSGDSANLSNMETLTANTGTLAFTGATNHIFIPKASTIHPKLQQNGTGSTTIVTNALDLGSNTVTITNGLCSLGVALTTTGALSFGNGGMLDLGTGLTHSVGSVSTGAATGTLRFNASTLRIISGNADLSNVAITKGSGLLEFTAAAAQNFIPRNGGGAYPPVVISGGGTVTVTTNNLIADSLIILSGTYNCGAGRTTTVAGMRGTALGNINIATGALTDTSEVVDLSQFGVITRGTGTLTLGRGSSGQTLIFGEGDTVYNLTQAGAGGTTVTTRGFAVANNLTVTTGTLNLGTGLTHHAIAVTGSATGTLAFGSSTLRVSGNATFTNLPVEPGTGTLAFIGTTTLTPRSVADTLPAIVVNGTSVTTATNTLHAGRLEIAAGTLAIGSGLTASVASIRGAGTLTFGTTSVLRVYGDSADFSGLAGLTPSTGTLQMTGTSAQTLIPHPSLTMPAVTQLGSGVATVQTHALNCGSNAVTLNGGNILAQTALTCGAVNVTSGTLTLGGAMTASGALTVGASGALDLGGGGLVHTVASVSGSEGARIDFNGSRLNVNAGNADFTNIAVTAGSGILGLVRTGADQTLYPRAGGVFPDLVVSAAGRTVTVSTNDLRAGSLTLTAGTFNIGTGRADTVVDVSGTGNLNFGTNSKLTVTGTTVDFSGFGTLTTGTGNTLDFAAPSGVQTFSPKSGSTHPAITHNAAGTLKLSSANLTTNGFTQNTGTLDFNGRNLTTVGGGNFVVVKGAQAAFANLDDRKITAAGYAQISGTAGDSIDIQAYGSARCTLAVTGTLLAEFARIVNCDATVSAGTAQYSRDAGGNSGWNFFNGRTWDGGGADNNWTTAQNWSGDQVPGAGEFAVFGTISTKNCVLDDDVTVRSVIFNTGYSGTFNFGSHTLTVTDSANFSGCAAVTAGSGALRFAGASPQSFIPKAGQTFPQIIQDGGGGTTIRSAALTAGALTLTSGTMNLGTGLTHNAASVSGSGGIVFGTSTLRVSGSADFGSCASVTGGTGTLMFIGTSAQNFIPPSSGSLYNITQNGSGGTTIISGVLTADNALTITSGELNLGAAGVTHSVKSVSGSAGGSINFNAATLKITGGNADFRNIDITPGTGRLVCAVSADHTLYPRSGAVFPNIKIQNASNTIRTYTSTNTLQTDTLEIASGYLYHEDNLTIKANVLTGRGQIRFEPGSVVEITGASADFSGLAAVSISGTTPVVRFSAGSGVQTFTPRYNTIHPIIQHTGVGTLKLDRNALKANGVAQSAGTLDLNGRNITTVNSGNFLITNGGSSSFANLDNRTITVAGYASLEGQPGDSLNMNPADPWTLAVTGVLTARYANIANSIASVSSGTAMYAADKGGNCNWVFVGGRIWDGGGGDGNWSTAENWSGDAVPQASDTVLFYAISTKNCVLDADASVAGVVFLAGYGGTFDFASHRLSVSGTADFRGTAGIIAGTGALEFTGTGQETQVFYGKSGATFPDIIQNGSAGTVVSGGISLTADELTVNAGTFDLGEGLTHSFTAVNGTGGELYMQSSILKVTSGDADFRNIGITPGTGEVMFTGGGAQTFYPRANAQYYRLQINATGTVTIAANGFSVIDRLYLNKGTLDLGAGLQHTVSSFTSNTTPNTLNFNSSILTVNNGDADFRNTDIIAGTGALVLSRQANQNFYPRSGAAFPAVIIQNGAYTTTIQTNGLSALSVTIGSGTLNLGTSLTHTVTALAGTGSIDFGSSTLKVDGASLDLSTFATITAGSGTIELTGVSAQTLTPHAVSTLPAIDHSGDAALIIAARNLTAASFAQSAGTLDLNGRNITVSGAFIITNATPSGFANLAGRKITVGGVAMLAGQSALNRLNLNPSSPCTLAVSGLLNALYADIANCAATVSAGNAVNCIDGGGNINWNFGQKVWNGLAGDGKWSTPGNWSGGAVPGPSDDVVFDATGASAACLLDVSASVRTIIFYPAYTAVFDFGAETLTVAGSADFRAGAAVNAGTGALRLSSASSQSLIPQAGTLMPAIIKEGTGSVLVSINSLKAAALVINGGTFRLGENLFDTVGNISGSGSLDFGSSALVATGGIIDFGSLDTLIRSTGSLTFAGSGAQAFTPAPGDTHPTITQRGAGTTTLQGNLIAWNLRLSQGTFHLGAGLTHSVRLLTNQSPNTGTLAFGSSTLEVWGGDADCRYFNIDPGSAGGVLKMVRQDYNQLLRIKSGSSFPDIVIANAPAYYTMPYDNALNARHVTVASGTFNISNGSRTNTVTGISGTGAVVFGGSTLQISGASADFGSMSAVDAGSGTLSFIAGSGTTQTLTPRPSDTLPQIYHAAGGTLRLGAALTANGLRQTAGTLDFNGKDMTIVNSGNFIVQNGESASLTGLNGSALVVEGDVSINGTSAATTIDMNPPGPWTMAVDGSLQAAFAVIGRCDAPRSAGLALSCTDAGGNSNWIFASGKVWDGGGGDSLWSTAANWAGDELPGASDTVVFGAFSADDCRLDVTAQVKCVVFNPSYTGVFDFQNDTLQVFGGADFRSGGDIEAGAGVLEFNGTGIQTFVPKTGDTLPNLVVNAAGTVRLSSNNLTAASVEIRSGTLELGTRIPAYSHTVLGSVTASGGGLDFGNAALAVWGSSLNLAGLASLTASTGAFVNMAGLFAQTIIPKAGSLHPDIRQSGVGGTTIMQHGLNAGVLTLYDNTTFQLGNGLSHTVSSVTSSGTAVKYLKFNSSTLRVTGNAYFRYTSITPQTGTLEFIGTGAQVFTPRATNTMFPRIVQSGSGTTTVTSYHLTADSLVVTGGVFACGSRTVTVNGVRAAGGSINFGTGTLATSAETVDLNGLSSMTPSAGTLKFIASSGTQVFTPKSGAAHPVISHTGDAALKLAADVQAYGFSQSGNGVFDFNGHDITIVNNGSFTVTDGRPWTFTGLGGRTITVSGFASLAGADDDTLGLNPGTGWRMAVTGGLTASRAVLAACTASVSAGVAINSVDGGGNHNWIFTDSKVWDGGGADNNWSTAENWLGDTPPTAEDVVLFSSASPKTCVVDADVTVKGLQVNSGYVGILDFGASTLTSTGTVNLKNAVAVLSSGATLAFTGTSPQTFTPKAGAAFNRIIQNGSGGTTVASNGFAANELVVSAGTLSLGAGLTHTAGTVAGTGRLDFSSSTLRINGSSADFSSMDTVIAGSGTIEFTGSSPQSLTPRPNNPMPSITQNGSGGTTVQTNAFSCGALTIRSGTFNLGAGLNHSAASLGGAGGQLAFNSSVLTVTAGDVDLSAIDVSAGSGAMVFARTDADQYLTPRAGDTLPDIAISNGSHATIVTGGGLRAGDLTISSGTFNAGAALADTFENIAGAGSLAFNSSAMCVLGATVDMGGLASVSAGTGSLAFIAPSGVQTFTPPPATLPAITHSGEGVLRLAGANLTASGFSQTAGTLDFNGRNVTIVNNGDFIVTKGAAAAFAGAAGCTVSAERTIRIEGQAGNIADMTAASTWTLSAGGTLYAEYAALRNCAAGSSPGIAMNCADSLHNAGWSFYTGRMWDGGGVDNNWSSAANWTGNTVPAAGDDAVFGGLSVKNCNMNVPASVGDIVLLPAYTGTFSFTDDTLHVAGLADFRSGGAITAGTGALEFVGASGTQTFIPKAGAVFPRIIQSGAGTTVVTTNALRASTLTVSGGTFNLGNGLADTLTAISGTGALDFGSATLVVTGDVDLKSMTAVNAGTGLIRFTGAFPQIFSPRSGSLHPRIEHTGSDTLRLAAANLWCGDFTNSAGVLDFNGRDMTVSGNLVVSNGTSATFAGLRGRTITVTGSASFAGQSGSLLNMNPDSLWRLTVAGALTADYAAIANCDASGGSTGQPTAACVNGGGNINWNINDWPVAGWTAAGVIPAAQIAQAKDGSGTVSVGFKVTDDELDSVTLLGFEYSTDGGSNWNAPANGDLSAALQAGWKDIKYGTAKTFAAAPAYSFAFHTKHGDVAGMDGTDQDDIRIRFKASDGLLQSVAPAVSEQFRIDNRNPQFTAAYPSAAVILGNAVECRAASDEPGKIWMVVVGDGAAAPSALQVCAGKDASGVTVAAGYADSALCGASEAVPLFALNLTPLTDYDFYFTAADTFGNLQSFAVKLDVTTNDILTPMTAAGYPAADTVFEDSAVILFKTDQNGMAYCVVLPDGAAQPTPVQVKAGVDAVGNPVAERHKASAAMIANTVVKLGVGGLSVETAYDVWVVAENVVPTLQITAQKADIYAPDQTPPSFASTYPNVAVLTTTNAGFAAAINESGTLYCVVVPAGAAAPSAQQVREGKNAAGTAVASAMKDSAVCQAGVVDTLAVSGLVPATAYDAYFAACDTRGNLQATAVKLSFVTVDASTPVVASVTSASADGWYGIGDTIAITVTFSEPMTLAGGNLLITLETGDTDRVLSIAPFTRLTSVSSIYVVEAGDSSAALTVKSPLTLSAGTLKDTAGTSAVLAVAPGANLAGRRLRIDGVRPVVSVTAPQAGDTSFDAAVSITLSETCTQGSVVWSRTGRAADPLSPHVRQLATGELAQGKHSFTALTAGEKLVRNAVYSLSVQVIDSAGNNALLDIAGILYRPQFAAIAVVPDTATVPADSTVDFHIEATDGDGNVLIVDTALWLVTNSIASVSATGLFTPERKGTTRVLARYGGLLDTTGTITVLPGEPKSVAVTPDSARIEIDSTLMFIATGFDKNGDTAALESGLISWNITGGIQAGAVTADGLFTALGRGNVTIVCIYDSRLTDTAYIDVIGWTRQIPPGGDVTMLFGQDVKVHIPAMYGFAGGTVEVVPLEGASLPEGMNIFGKPISFNHALNIPAAVTLSLRGDTAAIAAAGLDPSDARVYMRCGDTGTWSVFYDFEREGEWLSVQTMQLCHALVGVDTLPPVAVLPQPSSKAQPGVPFGITFTVTDNIANPTATVRYRIAGERTTRDTTIALDASGHGTFSFPGAMLGDRTVMYLAEGGDGVNSGLSATRDLIIAVPNAAPADSFQAGYYRMVSVPLTPSSTAVSSMLGDDVGPFDKKNWRMYDLQGETFVEVTSDLGVAIEPGKAVWMRVKRTTAVDVDSASTVAASAPYRIVLQPGWNAIASPFTFAVDWNDIVQSSGAAADSIMGLYAYDPVKKLWSDPSQTRKMDPWEGYLVRNMSAAPLTISVPSYAYGTQLSRGMAKRSGEVRLTINAADSTQSPFNRIIAGYGLEQAAESYDPADYMQPPRPDAPLHVYFEKAGWGRYSGRYMTDMRPPIIDGARWDFTVDDQPAEQGITLSVHGLAQCADSLVSCLCDMKRCLVFPLKQDSALTYYSAADERRDFRFLVGTEAYIEREIVHFRRMPSSFALMQNYPNPLRHSTTIAFQIPAIDGGKRLWVRARLEVFDMRGRRVTLLLDERKEPGYYQVQWDGCASGTPVAAGAYFYRLTAENKYRKTMKLVRVR